MNQVPSTADLEQMMRILGLPGDSFSITKDHTDARCRAELLARLSAGIFDRLGSAEARADLDLEERPGLHWAIQRLRRRRIDDAFILESRPWTTGPMTVACVRSGSSQDSIRGPLLDHP
jgi:hypothetical protein